MIQERQHWESFKDAVSVAKAIWADEDKMIGECLNMIIPHLKHKLKHGSKIFDLGCGNGRLLRPVSEKYPDILFFGIDFSASILRFAMCDKNILYYQNDGVTIPFPDNFFDAGYSMIMFQHIPNGNFAGYLKEVGRVLKKGGVFRFQFVEGEQHHFLSHNALLSDVIEWVGDAGMKCQAFDTGIYDTWKWVTITK